MSNGKQIKTQRCDDALSMLSSSGNAVFFTLTTPDVVGFDEIRHRWRGFRHWLLRYLRSYHDTEKVLYVSNYEKHPGYLQKLVSDGHGGELSLHSDGCSHGWHIHAVFSCYIPSSSDYFQRALSKYGFGRFDVRRVTSKGISDYLTKHALKAYRGLSLKERRDNPSARLRLVNASRGLPVLSDYKWVSSHLEGVRSIVREYVDEWKYNSSAVEHDIECRLCDLLKVSRRAQVLQLMGYEHYWEWTKFLEHLQCMQKCESICKNENIKKY